MVKYAFGPFLLDLDLAQLSSAGEEIALEPRAFSLLCYLIENNDRLISKDELVETIWDGRFISDAAVSTLVKTARRAVGDDGKAQKYIRTVHGRGFRFVGEVRPVVATASSPAATAEPEPTVPTEPDFEGGRPSIAVLPFRLIGTTDSYSSMADAVPAELISSLSRLRWLRVVARGSTFRFRSASPDLDTIRDVLGASYCLSGDVEVLGSGLALSVELSDTRDGRVVWGERLSGKVDDVHQMRSDIISLVTSSMELHISLNEAERARLRSPESLDAWSVYHVGLKHMYRFNRHDNAIAARHFARANELDPGFARGYAARSFISFQTAFLRHSVDPSKDIEDARRFAEKCVEIDPLDPFGNFTYGRSHWLRGDPEAGQAWIERAVSLSPSFAQGIYAHAWADVMAGRGAEAVLQLDTAIALSPLDPFLYAMQSARGIACLHEGDLQEAALWAERGARQPGAHYLIAAFSAAINRIAGNDEKARYWAETTLSRRPEASLEHFFGAFPMRDAGTRRAVGDALSALGFPGNDPDVSRA